MWNLIPDSTRFAFTLTVTALTLALGAASGAPLLAQGCASDPAPEAAARVVGLEASGPDLHLMLLWDQEAGLPASASLTLFDASGAAVASGTVVPSAGEITDEVLPDAFAGLVDHGLEYRVELSDDLMEPYPFRVEIDCSQAPCGYLLSGGFSADAVVLHPDLEAGLDSAAIQGSHDVLADLAAMFPALEGQVASFALQLGELDAQYSLPSGPGSCTCLWLTADRAGFSIVDSEDGTPLETSGIEGPGASHWMVAQSTDGEAERLVPGSQRLGLRLYCFDLLSWDPQGFDLDLPGPPGSTAVAGPVIRSCDAPCGGEVEHSITFTGRAAAAATDVDEVVASKVLFPDDVATGEATETYSYAIDGDEVFSGETTARAAILPGGLRKVEDDSCRENVTSRAAPSWAELETVGDLVAVTDKAPGTRRCSFAEVANSHHMRAAGEAGCALFDAYAEHVGNLRYDFFERIVLPRKGITKEPWCP